jgi:pimeloyl-ACP methyl ester carboxylesterase
MRRSTDSGSAHRRPLAHRAAGLACCAVAAASIASCGSASGPAEPPPATRDVGTTTVAPSEVPAPVQQAPQASDEAPGYTIDWEPVDERTDAGWITVPLDYADPEGPTIDLRVARHRADDDRRIGVLLADNGGPGAAASTIALNATRWFEDALLQRFDVVSWDPRGTGESAPVDCLDDAGYDQYFASGDITPDDAAERQYLVDQARQFASTCVARSGDVLPYIGTNNSARDMDAIRQALGEEQLSYFGFSYGSELGGVWATMFPTTVRAAVFDGASDPAADAVESDRQQRVGFEAALDAFLADCSAHSDCAFHNGGDAEGAYDALMAQVDASPIPTIEGRAPVNLAVATTAAVQAMYNDRDWPVLAEALRDAADGDGNGLLALYDEYLRRNPDGTYSNLLEAFQAITCADQPERPSPEESDAEAATLIGVAPRTFPQTVGGYFCTFFPPALDPRIDVTGAGAGPIVVIGTTGDPSTPLESSRAMAEALEDGRLVVVEANQHSGYNVNRCVNDVVNDYLIELAAPADGTVCT